MSDKNNAGKNFSGKDWIGISGVIIGILGIALSYYFYTLSAKEKSLSIIVDEEITPIIDSTKVQSNNFSVVDTGGKKIEGDISAFKIKIINDGDLPIWGEDTLSQLSIGIFKESDENSDKINIIDYSVDQSPRKYIIDPKIDLYIDPLSLNKFITLGYRILESRDEISITIIFSGKKVPSYHIHGAIEGISKIKTNSNPKIEKIKFLTISLIFTLFVMIIMAILGFSYRGIEKNILYTSILFIVCFCFSVLSLISVFIFMGK